MGVRVKPLVWHGFEAGPYEIQIEKGGMAHLIYHGSSEEEVLKGGYLSLVSMDEFKADAQEHHESFIMAMIEETP